ncbi:PIG-L family deacetylase [Clostridium perfringens]|nr:PIG-L family deacetylase [Clostridium perfringens]MBI6080518.1 PIG-L family deacetylase [Clostridium perfringens]MBI6086038.1 PIG-L family deacetylase [Clostridium perfringens]MBI6100206.1 PIG-L family deacetylase [Clostridium perfringens]MDV5105549.1 PIG-L family deacetylase [Clostridium perfringens]
MKKILLKYYYIILDGIGYIKYLYSKIYFNKNYKNINKEIDINKIKKVLFVTHPDDEIIFFYRELIKSDDWLVVCLTNGGNKIRQKEFEQAMNALNLQYIMFNFIDGNINWNQNKVRKNIKNILKMKDEWEIVATHNFEGEYGHKQHIKLHHLVKDMYNGKNLYISTPSHLLENKVNILSNVEKNKKIEFMNTYYKSQDNLAKYIVKYYNYEGITKLRD